MEICTSERLGFGVYAVPLSTNVPTVALVPAVKHGEII